MPPKPRKHLKPSNRKPTTLKLLDNYALLNKLFEDLPTENDACLRHFVKQLSHTGKGVEKALLHLREHPHVVELVTSIMDASAVRCKQLLDLFNNEETHTLIIESVQCFLGTPELREQFIEYIRGCFGPNLELPFKLFLVRDSLAILQESMITIVAPQLLATLDPSMKDTEFNLKSVWKHVSSHVREALVELLQFNLPDTYVESVTRSIWGDDGSFFENCFTVTCKSLLNIRQDDMSSSNQKVSMILALLLLTNGAKYVVEEMKFVTWFSPDKDQADQIKNLLVHCFEVFCLPTQNIIDWYDCACTFACAKTLDDKRSAELMWILIQGLCSCNYMTRDSQGDTQAIFAHMMCTILSGDDENKFQAAVSLNQAGCTAFCLFPFELLTKLELEIKQSAYGIKYIRDATMGQMFTCYKTHLRTDDKVLSQRQEQRIKVLQAYGRFLRESGKQSDHDILQDDFLSRQFTTENLDYVLMMIRDAIASASGDMTEEFLREYLCSVLSSDKEQPVLLLNEATFPSL